MSSGKNVCVNCQYEDASKTLDEMWKAEQMGIDPAELPAVWCNFYKKYIDNAKRQGVRRKNDGTYEDYIWCKSFNHY